MIISPYIFCHIKRNTFFSYTPFGYEPSFEVTPESLKTVYVAALAVAVFAYTMLYESVNVAFGGDAGVTIEGIGTDHGSTLNPATDKGNERLGLNIGDHLGPYLAASAKDTEDRGLSRASASSGAPGPLRLTFISPLASQIGLVNLYSTAEDLEDILGHNLSYQEKSTQNTSAFKSDFKGYIMAWKAFKKRHQKGTPFRCRQSEGQTTRLPLISAPHATVLFPPNFT